MKRNAEKEFNSRVGATVDTNGGPFAKITRGGAREKPAVVPVNLRNVHQTQLKLSGVRFPKSTRKRKATGKRRRF